MARDQAQVICPPGEWTELTNGDITAITFQVTSGAVKIRFTTGSAPAAVTDPGYEYHAGPGYFPKSGELRVDVTSLAIGAGMDRCFAQPINGRQAVVIVDHA